jgi:hypothetical protein
MMNSESLAGRKNVFYRKPDKPGSLVEQKMTYVVRIEKVFDTSFPIEGNKEVVRVRIVFSNHRRGEVVSSDHLFPSRKDAELTEKA